MSKIFLDPEKPLHTCREERCDGCGVSGKLVCHFNGRQLAVFLTLAVPVFILAGFILDKFMPLLLVPWIFFIFVYFGFIEIRVMCSHCPHYAEPQTKYLKCWANYGSPKLWRYNPGPLSFGEEAVFYAGFAVILVPPIAAALLLKSYILLSIYLILLAGWLWALNKLYCRHCMNFACPLNHIDQQTRDEFFEKNPVIKKAWKNG